MAPAVGSPSCEERFKHCAPDDVNNNDPIKCETRDSKIDDHKDRDIGIAIDPFRQTEIKKTEKTTQNKADTSKPQQKPPNYLVLAIFTTFFCCPLGLVAFFNGSMVGPFWKNGDHAEAKRNSRSARLYGLIGLVLGITCLAVGVVYYVVEHKLWLN